MRNEMKLVSGGRKLSLFMMVSLDGYMEGPNHDLSWHHVDEEFNSFAAKQLQETDAILFGRKTYELMESYWPTKQGLEDDPAVANLMNSTQKYVVSHSLQKVIETENWQHVTLIKDSIVKEISKIKQQLGGDIIVLGSNNLCVTLLENRLLDEIRLMINPVVIGNGTSLFKGIHNKINFQLTASQKFTSGNLLLTYRVLSHA